MQIKLTCARCSADFVVDVVAHRKLGLTDLPKSCPHCKDGQQQRPPERTVASRKLLQEFPAVRIAIPVEYFSVFEPSDSHVEKGKKILRASIKGKDIGSNWVGASWDGRLEIFVNGSSELPKVARVRVMEVTREKGNVRQERRHDEGAMVPGAPENHPGQPKVTVEVQYEPTHQYLALDPLPEDTEPTAALVLASVNRKTTIKGYGRQWGCSLNADEALWACHFSNSARSGRFGNQGVIAVVDDSHSVITRQTGDVQGEVAYTLSHPGGAEHASVPSDCAPA